MRPACGWVEVKPVEGFCDKNREIRDRVLKKSKTDTNRFFRDHYVFGTKNYIAPQTFLRPTPIFNLRTWPANKVPHLRRIRSVRFFLLNFSSTPCFDT